MTPTGSTQSTITLSAPEDISLRTFQAVSYRGASVHIDSAARDRLDSARDRLMVLVEDAGQHPIYGVNVGAGDGSFTFLSEDQRRDYARGLNSATSFGRCLPENVVRGITLARLSSFLDGSAGVSAVLAEHIARMLDGELPPVPVEGTGGSGEILPLGHLFASVPEELELGPKESMALVNGSPASAALGADVAIWGAAVIRVATLCAAVACDALDAAEEHFDPALGDLWGYPEETAALAELHALLAHPGRERDSHQARVSVRILPRVLAAAHRALADLERDAEIALGHVGDNPAFIDDQANPRVLSNGGFHNQRIMVAVNNFTRSLADLTQLMQHLLHALYQSRTAMPTQDNLSLGITYMAASDWSEEARSQAEPSVLTFSAVGQNDVPFPMFSAWRKARRVRECLLAQSSLLLAMGSQSLFMTDRETTPALREFLSAARDVFSPVNVRRDVGADLQRLTEHLDHQVEALMR